MKIVFSGLGIIMGVALGISLFYGGDLILNVQFCAYGFILAGLGYLIDLIKKREQTIDSTIEYIIEKKMKSISDEVKTIRLMMLKLEDRRIQKEMEKDGLSNGR